MKLLCLDSKVTLGNYLMYVTSQLSGAESTSGLWTAPCRWGQGAQPDHHHPEHRWPAQSGRQPPGYWGVWFFIQDAVSQVWRGARELATADLPFTGRERVGKVSKKSVNCSCIFDEHCQCVHSYSVRLYW